MFDYCIGIDYSGAETSVSRLRGLQVYMAEPGKRPVHVRTPAAPPGQVWNWTRSEIAHWLVGLAEEGKTFVVGIDHAFSFPYSYFCRNCLTTWDEFLVDFRTHWPTDQPYRYVEEFREDNMRTGRANEFRLTDRWSSSAKSVFQFDVQGQVAKSTHAGLPWLLFIRNKLGPAVHFWPFDGFEVPPGKSVIAEVYPSIFRNRYPHDSRRIDEQDAYAIARWLSESVHRDILKHYLHPPLNDEEQALAKCEGWILGIS